MNTFVLLGLVVLLVLFLLRARRARAGGREPGAGRSAMRGLRSRGRRSEPPAPTPPPDPAPADPFAARTPPPPPPAPGGPRSPMDWTPHEMIVEPGWPLPGEISGSWSAGPETSASPVATLDPPAPAAVAAHEVAATVAEPPAPAADSWQMPALAPVEPASAPHPAAEAVEQPSWMPAAADEAPAWPGAADADPPIWRPEPAPAPAAADIWAPEPSSADDRPTPPAPETQAPGDEAATLPVWRPEATEAPGADATEPDVAEAESGGDLPAWTPLAAEPEAAPEPEALEPETLEPEPAVIATEPGPAAIAPEPKPEPELIAYVAPRPEPELPAWTPPAEPAVIAEAVAPMPVPDRPIGDQSAEVAELVPSVLSALRPLVRVSDHVGVTPRMLVVIRALAESPLSVGEQAARLGVSRPVVADIAARLEQMGLTRRERDERDRRRVRLALTDRGRRVHAEADETPPAGAVAEALGRMAAGERDELVRGLRALARSASAS